MTAPTDSQIKRFAIRGFRVFGSEARRLNLISHMILVREGNSYGELRPAPAARGRVANRISKRDLFGEIDDCARATPGSWNV